MSKSRTSKSLRRAATGPRWRRMAVGLLALMLVGLLVPARAGRVAAEEPGEREGIGPYNLLSPISDSLGGSAWLASQGMDPRLQPIETERGTDLWNDMAAPSPGERLTAAAAQPLVPFREPGPSFSRNILVTRALGLFGIQTEPHIVVNPYDSAHLVMGTIDYNYPGMSVYVSFDGGETWDGPNQVRYFQEDLAGAGDPVLSFGQDETVYMTFISLGLEEFRIGTIASSDIVSSMAVAKSTDGGLTWSDPVSAARSDIVTTSNPDQEGKERGTITSAFLDKPWMDVGPNPDDPTTDIIHLTYTEFATTYSLLYADELPFLSNPFTETTIRYTRSLDGGITWSEPIAVSPTVLQAEGASEEGEGGFNNETGAVDDEGNPIEAGAGQAGQAPATITQELQEQGPATFESNRTVQGSQPKAMADGTVVVAYLDTTNDGVQEGLAAIMVTTSTDGVTWTTPVRAAAFREPHFSPRNSTFRWWGTAFPQLAVGLDQEVYVAVTFKPTDKPTDDGDVFFLRSTDKGQTWDTPVRLNGDDTDRPQFYPSIDVSPDGIVHVMWGDMRDDPNEVRYHIYYTNSEDGGDTWGFTDEQAGISSPDVRVTDFASNSLRGFPGGRFIGDYFSLAAAEDDVYMVWADTRLGEFGGPFQQIGFARKTAIANPEIFLNPASGVAGRQVTIQGFSFQPDSIIAITLGDAMIATDRTDVQGQFTTDIFMPITGEGASNVVAYDESGNVAISSYFTEAGFDTVQRTQQEMMDQITALQGQLAATSGTPEPGGARGAATPLAVPTSAAPPRLEATPESEGSVLVGGVGGFSPGTIGGLAGYAVGLAGAGYAFVRWRGRRR